MFDALEAPQVNDENKQAAIDISKRAMPGSYIYIICWLMIILPSGFYKKEPVFVFCFSSLLVALSLFRLIAIKKFERIYSFNPLLWKVLINFNILLSGGIWGGFYAASTIIPTFSPISFLILISLAGTVGGGVSALSPDLKLSIWLLLSLLMPSIAAMILFPVSFDLAVCLLFIAYFIGMTSVAYTLNKEYWQALKSSYLVIEYAAELEKLNTQDGLTGLRNRKFFDEELVREIKRAERRRTELSLLMMDIDHFKHVNDTYGHLAGDKCLQTAADVFTGIIKRQTDTIVRYGGEEFAIILPEMAQEKAIEFAEKIRDTFENTKIIWNGLPIPLTLSIGVSSVKPVVNFKYELLIRSADEALYHAKETGRNRVFANKLTAPEGQTGFQNYV